MNKCFIGDCHETMRQLISDGVKVQMCVTSPPYWGLRDYGCEGQLGLEKTPGEYVANMVGVFRLVRELLNDDGVVFLNLGDSYFGGGRGGGGSFSSERPGWREVPCGIFGKEPEDSQDSGCLCESLCGVCREVYRRRPRTYELKPKDLVGIPWMTAFALRNDGWYLRQDIIWSKPNPMPESVKDRCTKSHEYIFMLSKQQKYYYDQEAIKEKAIYYDKDPRPPGIVRDIEYGYDSKEAVLRNRKPIFKNAKSFNGKYQDKQRGHSRRHAGFNDRWDAMTKEEQCGALRNKRSVWEIATKPYPEAHFATFPPVLIEPCILAGSRIGDIVLDPFFGSGTTGEVAQNLGRKWIGCELNPQYEPLQKKRVRQQGLVI